MTLRDFAPGLRILGQNCPQLLSLAIHGLDTPDQALHTFGRGCQKLQSLHLVRCRFSDDGLLTFLHEAKSLHSLDLYCRPVPFGRPRLPEALFLEWMANRETCLKYLVVSDCTPQFRQRAFALLPDLDLHVYASDDPVPSLLANVNGQAELQPVPVQPDVSARQHYIEAEHTHRRLFSLVHKMVGGGPEAQRDAAVEMMRRATEQSAARGSFNVVGGGGVVDVADSSVSGGLEEEEEEEGEPVLFDAEDDDAASRMVMEEVSVDPWVRGRMLAASNIVGGLSSAG